MIFSAHGFIFYKEKVLFIFHKEGNIWMHPGGGVEPDEFFDDALKREIKEEVNLDIEIINNSSPKLKSSLIDFHTMKIPFLMNSALVEGKKRVFLDYICVPKEPINIKIQEEEIADYKWLTKDDIQTIDTYPEVKIIALKAFKEYEKLTKQF